MVQNHPDLDLMLPYIESVRHAIEGSAVVKSKTYRYLPHPSQADTKSESAGIRYNQYIGGAEWDSFPELTERSMLGKLKLDGANVELHDRLEYLINDIDGDGLSLKGGMYQTAKNILEVKWHLLLADYQGLSDLDVSDLSIADLKVLNPRAKIKQYTRENVVTWNYDRINGVMQLTYIMLRELGTEFNYETKKTDEVVSYLVLGLDETGYYQQKIVETKDGQVEGERTYVSVGGSVLQWIPIQIATDSEQSAGAMPKGLGFLGSICDLAYARYRVSADYKEAMRMLPPTTYIKGMGEAEWSTFQEVNGRAYIATGAGAVNMLDGEASIEVIGADTELQSYERYFEQNKSKVQALGGVFKEDASSAKTATESAIDSAEQNATLVDIATGVEQAFKNVILYCGMFEGLYSPDNIEQNKDDVVIEITRDFDRIKLSHEEVRVTLELVMSGLMTKEQAVKKLVAGGWLEGDAETLLQEIEESGFLNVAVPQQQAEVVPNE